MSAEVGGRSGKLGDAYERLWAVRHALRLIAGELRRLRWEPLGNALKGIDLELVLSNGTREGHQLKRQHGEHGRWTVAELIAEGVLDDARNFLGADTSAQFVFVSSDPAIVLKDLADRAPRESDSETFFSEHVCASRRRQEDFSRLLAHWGLDPANPASRSLAHNLLHRVSCQTIDRGRSAAQNIKYMASLQFSGDPDVMSPRSASTWMTILAVTSTPSSCSNTW